jgi:ADP-L-glycero-D-manno-heptose 6-epimerase
MIIVTGGAGFIGSALVWRLNQIGKEDIVIVDNFGKTDKWKNLLGLNYFEMIEIKEFLNRIIDDNLPFDVDCIVHLGACSDTTEKDGDFLHENNTKYTIELAKFCLPKKIKFIVASSAATYGDGEKGYADDENNLLSLRPLNMYAYSKHMFDIWAYKEEIIDKIVILKYFNVYGPNEYHKGEMRSVVHKAFEQIQAEGKIKLFKSYKSEYADGEQKRDFIYVKDAVDATLFFIQNNSINGVFNIGTGIARSWNDLAKAIFKALGKPVNIEYIDMPENLRSKYQYITQADISKLRKVGFNHKMHTLEEGIEDYVKNYLLKKQYLAF